MANSEKRLGVALVGLGSYSSGELAPALEETQHCYLAGIVTGSPDKAVKWSKKYELTADHIYNYENFDNIKDDDSIDIVYIVLPNSLHAQYVIKAAKAGKHVICEKPMAITVEECDAMIAACNEAGVMLSIGYRLHFEPYNKEMMRLGKEQVFGGLKKIKAEHGMSSAKGWRLDKSLAGGGPLMDVGIYCVQAACYLTGMEPIVVTAKEGAKTKPEKYKSIEESMTWEMEFPGGIIAECSTSYSKELDLLRAEAEKGWFELSPAFEYGSLAGTTTWGKMDFPNINQQAAQMDAFAKAINENKPTSVPGEMGRRDVRILQAIYKAMASGRKVSLSEETFVS